MQVKGKGDLDGKHGVQAAETVLQVLLAFVGTEPMPMLKTLAERAEMHPAKVHRYLVSLMRMGFVEQDVATSRYRLGAGTLRLAFAAMLTVDAIRVARPLMHEFTHSLGNTVVLAMWNDEHPTIVLKETVPAPIQIAAREGTPVPILRSAIGRVFGAWMPRSKTGKLLSEELSQLRAHPVPGCPRNMAETEALFEEVRKRGLARATGQLSPSAHSLAAPVFDNTGTLAAVICALGAAQEFDSTWTGPTAKALTDAAGRLSRALGFAGMP